jgi:hypothetical protein
MVSGGREVLLASRHYSSADDIKALIAGETLIFGQTPTEQLLWLRITVSSKKGTRRSAYAKSFTLRYPEPARIESLGFNRAAASAGDLGDVVIVLDRSFISRISNVDPRLR